MAGDKAEDPKKSYFNERGEPRLAAFRRLFGLASNSELGVLVGEGQGVVSQRRSMELLNNQRFASLMEVAAILLDQLGDEGKVKLWLHSGRPEWLGESPMDLMRGGRVEMVARYLRQMTDPRGLYGGIF